LILVSTTTCISQKKLTETEKLATTAKVWGFLKYYHPNVADGNFNWDEMLFKMLPLVKKSENAEQLSQVYLDVINSVGVIKPCKKCQQDLDEDYFDNNFNLSWINNSPLITPELSEKLKYIENNRHQGDKYYVTLENKNVGNIKVTNEIVYENF